ncbi:hypothetical protein CVT26_003161 [Gymnopilus dilepis]|uniref:Uncharacterized protein n=1 Tax=Gymnopilus dilepis TaxID=231916 RepID=A0A409X163_9AGAR|nr:hypothetical protein CVT26_003161 [Gymnopilus dilepis]
MGIAPLVSQDEEPDAHQTALIGEQEPNIKQESKECSLWECSSKIKEEPVVKNEFGAPGECHIKQEYDVKQEFDGIKQECEIKQEFGIKQEFEIKQESLVKQEFDGKRGFDTGVLTREENAPERSQSQLPKRTKRARSVESKVPAGRSSKRLRKGRANDFSVHAEIIDLT